LLVLFSVSCGIFADRLRLRGCQQKQTVLFFKEPTMSPISGNTYPVKDQLKQLGAKWDALNKVWMIEDAKLPEALEIVKKGESAPKKPYSGPKKCVVCGVVQTFHGRYPNVKIYRSGECQDCYEERKMGY